MEDYIFLAKDEVDDDRWYPVRLLQEKGRKKEKKGYERKPGKGRSLPSDLNFPVKAILKKILLFVFAIRNILSPIIQNLFLWKNIKVIVILFFLFLLFFLILFEFPLFFLDLRIVAKWQTEIEVFLFFSIFSSSFLISFSFFPSSKEACKCFYQAKIIGKRKQTVVVLFDDGEQQTLPLDFIRIISPLTPLWKATQSLNQNGSSPSPSSSFSSSSSSPSSSPFYSPTPPSAPLVPKIGHLRSKFLEKYWKKMDPLRSYLVHDDDDRSLFFIAGRKGKERRKERRKPL